MGRPDLDLGLFWAVRACILAYFGGTGLDFGLFWEVRPEFRHILEGPDMDLGLIWGSNLHMDRFWGVRTWIWAYFGQYMPGFGPILGGICLDLILF